MSERAAPLPAAVQNRRAAFVTVAGTENVVVVVADVYPESVTVALAQ